MVSADDIKLEPRKTPAGKTVSGSKNIIINGRTWGRTWMSSHGPRGSSYNLYDAAGNVVTEPPHIGDRARAVKIASSSDLLKEITRLINIGELRDPDIVLMEYNARRRERIAAQEEQDRRDRIERHSLQLLEVLQALVEFRARGCIPPLDLWNRAEAIIKSALEAPPSRNDDDEELETKGARTGRFTSETPNFEEVKNE